MEVKDFLPCLQKPRHLNAYVIREKWFGSLENTLLAIATLSQDYGNVVYVTCMHGWF